MAKKKKLSDIKKILPKPVIQFKKLSHLSENILWNLIYGAKGVSELADAVNTNVDTVSEEIENLENRGLVTGGGTFRKRYEITDDGTKALGVPKVQLSTGLAKENIKSGQETWLLVTAKNTGDIPLKDALLKIVAPKFLNINRYNSIYDRGEEKINIEFPLTELHPGETQAVNFRLKADLTSHTVSSRYKIEVHAYEGEMLSDKKEVGILVES